MNPYAALDLPPTASLLDVKRAYKKLAMKYHPDRKDGNEAKFKEINQAYEELCNTVVDTNNNTVYRPEPAADTPQTNVPLTIKLDIDLEDVVAGVEATVDLTLKNNQHKLATINIPAGVTQGQQIRYPEIGDDSNPLAPPGDLIVTVNIKPHPVFQRAGLDIVHVAKLPPWDLILGTTITIPSLERSNLEITVPPGSQHNTVLTCSNRGLPGVNSTRGNLYVKLSVKIPTDLTTDQLTLVKQLKAAIEKS